MASVLSLDELKALARDTVDAQCRSEFDGFERLAATLSAEGIDQIGLELVFRIARNLCVGMTEWQTRLGHVLLPAALSMADAVLSARKKASVSFLQMLSNLATGHEANQSAIWTNWFISSSVPWTHGPSQPLVFASLYQVIKADASRRDELSRNKAALTACLAAFENESSGGGEWALLVLKALLEVDALPNIVGSVEPETVVQVLQLVDAVLSEQEERADLLTRYVGPASVDLLCAMIVRAGVDPSTMQSDSWSASWALAVHIFGIVAAADVAAMKERAGSLGAVEALTAALMAVARIDPPPLPSQTRSLTPGAPERARHSPFGLKSDILRALANCALNCRANQDAVRLMGGIEAVLDHCRTDDHNPFQREWALLAVANLCGNNLENQTLIRELEASGMAEEAQMAEMGLNAHIDAHGKVAFQRVPPQPAGSAAAASSSDGPATAAPASAAAGPASPPNE